MTVVMTEGTDGHEPFPCQITITQHLVAIFWGLKWKWKAEN